MGQREFDLLRQCVEDALTPVSEHLTAVRTVRLVVSELRAKCPNLDLECVFQQLPSADPGHYAGAQREVSNVELLNGLTPGERDQLRMLVSQKLEEAEKAVSGVFLSDTSVSSEDWQRSLQAPLTELPDLPDEEKAFARKFGIADENYARSRLSIQYGQERMLKRGAALGSAIARILRGLGSSHKVLAVDYEARKPRWLASIQTPQGGVNIAIPVELADDIVDSNAVQDQERLQTLLRSSLERRELILDREHK